MGFMNLVCHSQSFAVEKGILVDNFSLFIDQADLFRKTSYDVRSRVPTEVFAEFIQACSGIEINLTETNCPFLLSLSREFGFHRLLRNCVTFLDRNPPSKAIIMSAPVDFPVSSRPSSPVPDRSTAESRIVSIEDEVSRLGKLFGQEEIKALMALTVAISEMKSVIDSIIPRVTALETAGESFKIFIKDLAGKQFDLHVYRSDRIEGIKHKLVVIPPDELMFCGKTLEDENTVQDCRIMPGDTLDLVRRPKQQSPASGGDGKIKIIVKSLSGD
jgi:hypothetical protein